MIKGTFKRNEAGRIISCEVSGHAGLGNEGEDIVCAAISALTFNSVNSIDSLAGVQPLIDKNDDVKGGYLYVEVPTSLTQEQTNIIQILLESLLLGFQAVQEEYSEYIQIETITKK
ncbi:MAG TPA: ribosomal-processing cysteine protease Prp [Candidatus Tetragenococcus pullicola]|nr:ribosomal-processing cysteine protease Prp [Candidatus Tetragenococcus pullicola]